MRLHSALFSGTDWSAAVAVAKLQEPAGTLALQSKHAGGVRTVAAGVIALGLFWKWFGF
ncbi:MAG TPA: hypothetical protein VHQ95_19890 [Pyrinomonadaceae bacterium]|jgi:hypothetical protein|nr:hypothetical protein [Pyrinomonadaceae bacterium]